MSSLSVWNTFPVYQSGKADAIRTIHCYYVSKNNWNCSWACAGEKVECKIKGRLLIVSLIQPTVLSESHSTGLPAPPFSCFKRILNNVSFSNTFELINWISGPRYFPATNPINDETGIPPWIVSPPGTNSALPHLPAPFTLPLVTSQPPCELLVWGGLALPVVGQEEAVQDYRKNSVLIRHSAISGLDPSNILSSLWKVAVISPREALQS